MDDALAYERVLDGSVEDADVGDTSADVAPFPSQFPPALHVFSLLQMPSTKNSTRLLLGNFPVLRRMPAQAVENSTLITVFPIQLSSQHSSMLLIGAFSDASVAVRKRTGDAQADATSSEPDPELELAAEPEMKLEPEQPKKKLTYQERMLLSLSFSAPGKRNNDVDTLTSKREQRQLAQALKQIERTPGASPATGGPGSRHPLPIKKGGIGDDMVSSRTNMNWRKKFGNFPIVTDVMTDPNAPPHAAAAAAGGGGGGGGGGAAKGDPSRPGTIENSVTSSKSKKKKRKNPGFRNTRKIKGKTPEQKELKLKFLTYNIKKGAV
jgi:hypothetical protein